MRPCSKRKLWEDDVNENITLKKNSRNDANKVSKKKTVQKKKKQVDSNDSGTGEDETQYVLVYDEKVSDVDYFKSRIKTEWSDSENSEDGTITSGGSPEEDTGGEEDSSRCKSIALSDTDDRFGGGQFEDLDCGMSQLKKLNSVKDDEEDGVLHMDRLFVRNLPYAATEDELEEYFSKVGKLSQVHLVLTNRLNGPRDLLTSSTQLHNLQLEHLRNSTIQYFKVDYCMFYLQNKKYHLKKKGQVQIVYKFQGEKSRREKGVLSQWKY